MCIRDRVKAGDKTISLPPKEFDLLVKLARNEHIVLKREQLLESVWGLSLIHISWEERILQWGWWTALC